MSWLIDRAFVISTSAKQNKGRVKSTVNKNKVILMNVLYNVNKNNLLKVLSKNLEK